MISLIVAVSENGVIGAGGELPWRLPADLRRFKALTMGKPIVMGRKTWESIGRPLPGRRSIVVTRQRGYRASGAEVVHSAGDAFALSADADEIMVIGGGQLYEECLSAADRIYRTRVHAVLDGDAFFPELDAARWECVSAEQHPAGDGNDHAFTFERLERR